MIISYMYGLFGVLNNTIKKYMNGACNITFPRFPNKLITCLQDFIT